MSPKHTGWYWFLPDENCPSPTSLLRTDRPVIVLVGQDKYTRDMPPPRLVVRFALGPIYVDDLSGDWHECKIPEELNRKAWERRAASADS